MVQCHRQRHCAWTYWLRVRCHYIIRKLRVAYMEYGVWVCNSMVLLAVVSAQMRDLFELSTKSFGNFRMCVCFFFLARSLVRLSSTFRTREFIPPSLSRGEHYIRRFYKQPFYYFLLIFSFAHTAHQHTHKLNVVWLPAELYDFKRGIKLCLCNLLAQNWIIQKTCHQHLVPCKLNKTLLIIRNIISKTSQPKF